MLNIVTVPAFDDNYLWLIHDGVHAAVVDPGDAVPIFAALDIHKLSLTAILLTHHHRDHVGGVKPLAQHFDVPVFGPRREAIDGITHPLVEGDEVLVPELDLRLSVLDVPGHTLGHIAYVAHDQGWLFCGDTLFAGGCGRLFEGTPEQMRQSLAKLAALPDSTLFFCAHEYTLSNLRFARAVEPGNEAIVARQQIEQAKRDRGEPTIPSTIGLEKATNPFLRYRVPAVVEHVSAQRNLVGPNPLAVFTALREWKNAF